MDLKQMYREIVNEHNLHPTHKHDTENPTVVLRGVNPSCGAVIRESLKSGDLDALLAEGLRQEDTDAAILNINAGLPGIDEAATLAAMVERFQSITRSRCPSTRPSLTPWNARCVCTTASR